MKKQINLPPIEEVHLPHFFGMRPGIYILVLLAVASILLVFLLGFLPGIIRGGRYVTFTSALAHTGVSVDGTYVGGTPYQFFVPSGEHEITFSKAGISIDTTSMKVDHPTFLTWLFHRTSSKEADVSNLTKQEKEQINRYNIQEIVDISAITSFDAIHPYPPLFTTLVEDALAMGLDQTLLQESFALAATFITSKTMLDDALKAREALVHASELIDTTLAQAKQLFDSSSTKEVGLPSQDLVLEGKHTLLKAGDFEQGGITYPSSSFVMGTKVPMIFPETNKAGIPVLTESFTIATTPVSQYQWALFIEDNPKWDKHNIEVLQQENLTDEFYLSGILPSIVFATSKPVHNISYKAAEAFCEWLREKTGKEVFIPTHQMWTLASLQAKEKAYTRSLTIIDDEFSSPTAMLGGVWEFTQTPYIPLQRITDYQRVAHLYQSFALTGDVVVKGGSYLNAPSSIDTHTVGVVDTTTCADQIGFRIAWND